MSADHERGVDLVGAEVGDIGRGQPWLGSYEQFGVVVGSADDNPERTPLPGKRAPAALVVLEPGRLGLCGFLEGELTLVDIDRDAHHCQGG